MIRLLLNRKEYVIRRILFNETFPANILVVVHGSKHAFANNLLITHQDTRGYERELEDIPSHLDLQNTREFKGITGY